MCQCDKCTIYCNGKSFERKICSYVSTCDLNDGDQCLDVTPISKSTSPAADQSAVELPPVDPSPVDSVPVDPLPSPVENDSSGLDSTEDLNPSMYPCWTKHNEKAITSKFRVTAFQNGTEIPKISDGLSQFEAKRICDILGFRI